MRTYIRDLVEFEPPRSKCCTWVSGTKRWLHRNEISQTVAQGNGAVRPTTPTELKDRVRERIFSHQLEQAVGGRSS